MLPNAHTHTHWGVVEQTMDSWGPCVFFLPDRTISDREALVATASADGRLPIDLIVIIIRTTTSETTMSKGKFEKAVEIVRSLPKGGPIQPTQEDQLFFYSYYKQATEGDVKIPRPGMLDFTGKAKWDAWDKVKGTAQEDAWAKYVEKLLAILGTTETDEAKGYIAQIEAA